MKQSTDTQWFRRFFASRIFFFGVLIMTIGIGVGVARAYYQQYQLRKEIDTLQQEIESLTQKKLESVDMLSYVTSPVFAEEKARVELNMKKPGEHVAVVDTPAERHVTDAVGASSVAGQRSGNPIQWWYYFLYPSYERGTQRDTNIP